MIADHHGTVWALGVRDAGVRRRQRTLLAESADAVLGAEQDRELRAAAMRLCLAAGYRNAGTVEFLYDPRLRALQVGSVDRIIPAAALRPYLVDAVERGMRRTLERRPTCSR